ncbi:mitochondrial import receptor subunit TOM7 homolog [Trichogramma pretiosum]|uniref:mitochondrial import receptor subunit TOM7 homolog n=1 Tax=Trichogramma pretiosum TaxID=7493 RepID=UPI0006C9A620|nr:mitochondrial import receptor subunit TOM7 homolog [Trichogramma pretiosum]
MTLSPKVKQKISVVLALSRTAFHWGFIPAVLYLGFRKGTDPGMPELSIFHLLWQ